MKAAAFIFLTLFLFVFQTAVSAAGEMPGILPGDIPSGEITRNDFFDGRSLWGYIDGGADVYLEYGFSKLHLQEVTYKQKHAKVEIYQMKTPEAAFGIFSLYRYKCSPGDSLSRFSCVSAYQVQASRDRYYISVINDNGTPEEKELCMELAGIVLKKIAQDSIEIPAPFSNNIFRPYISGLKFFNGNLGIQNGFSAWAEQFDSYKKCSMYILPVETSAGYAYTGRIRFSDAGNMQDFLNKAGFKTADSKVNSIKKDGIMRSVKKTGPDELVYLETNLASREAEKFLGAID